MSNRTAATLRKQRQQPPGDYQPLRLFSTLLKTPGYDTR